MEQDNVSCLVYCSSSQVSEPLKGTLKWTTQKHYTHTHPCYRYSAPGQQAQRRNLPGNSLHIASGLAMQSMDQQSMPSVIQVLTLLAPRVSSSVLAPSVGAHIALASSPACLLCWAPLVHSFFTVNMKQMPAFNTGVHCFGMLVSVLPLQCFYEGLPDYFERYILCV